ncbi:hypothetical protein FC093_17585 [Ilyomonas limi]|jgi:hypothetical protein|uniref:Uncharacterized protein n=1 Tax=Ilyomonas limi TaxID=2575867 RepID=A0A4U3KZ29_9BACT|nr:hypothetical protein [Ilyomonas limi]TKK66387.1 hypothetical protein FC093_17585 [Ilyomonas limi]
MKKLDLTRQDIAPLALLFVSLSLMIIGIVFKSLIVLAGVTGIVLAWFLCIDTLIVNHKMNIIKRIVFGGIIIALPIALAMYMGA